VTVKALVDIGSTLSPNTWISIYWFSRAGPVSSIRIFYEMVKSGESILSPKTSVPVGISFFPKEPVRAPRAYMLVSLHALFLILEMLKTWGVFVACCPPKRES